MTRRPLRLLVVSGGPQVKRLPELYLQLLGDGAELVFSAAPESLPETVRAHPSASVTTLPLERTGADAAAVGIFRAAADLTRFLDPELEHGGWPRRRAARRLLRLAGYRDSRASARSASELRLAPETYARLRASFRTFERLLPPPHELAEAIGALDVDAVLLVSRCLPGGAEPDVVKVARRLGLPSVLLVWSWDNLSSKAVLNEHPDRLLVWNEIQAREAVEFHAVDRRRVEVVGAANFDRFFEELDAARSRSGEGPRAARPRTILYLGSSAKVAPREVPIFERWLQAVRASGDPRVRDAHVVVRPHPTGRGWESWAPPDERVRLVRPAAKLEPVTLAELLREADAAVALNTSAELEAAIAGVPVLTFRAGDEARGQEASVHFWYLLEAEGGFVVDAPTLEEHVERLAAVLGADRAAASTRALVERFVRPDGIAQPVVPVVASAVLDAARADEARPAPSGPLVPPTIRAGAAAAGGAPRIVVVAPRDHVRALPEVFRELIDSGATLLFAERNPAKLRDAIELLDRSRAQVVELPFRRTGDEAEAVELLRAAGDLVLLFHPDLSDATWSRARAARRLLKTAAQSPRPGAERLARLRVPPPVQAIVADALRRLEQLVPAAPALSEALAETDADAVLLVSRCSIRGPEPEVLKAARDLGLPSTMLVYSWDNLSSKAALNEHPDRLLVWNDLQRREAISLHGVEPSRVAIVGAANFDRFFAELAREERAGLNGSARRTVLYLGSSKASDDEPAIVERWLGALRAAEDPLVREALVVIRPHPGSTKLWKAWQAPDDPLLSLQPGAKGDPAGLARALRAADAVVGLSTTAEIEAAIAGRPVVTFRAGGDAPAQEGLRHFYYLLEGHGGFVVDAPTLDEHVLALARALHGDYDAEALDRFVRTFVRPRGIDRQVAPLVASTVLDPLPVPARAALPASS
jgi:hypothetical protein